MYPRFQDGDFIILRKTARGSVNFRAGETIVFEHELYGTMVKRVGQADDAKHRLFVLAEHDDGLDSRQLGWIDAGRVLGKVIMHIRRPQPAHQR